ncbi:MAG TPA: helix-turn-helix domain-containing GNAT family N-acetyltransferase [Roseiarcus sp.]|jgi:DNA-binding MarR family transcriptional regulator/GNAT superfamily N-acetyltransferase
MDRTQIQRVRRFNRLVTQRVGALQDGYLSRGRPLGEARLIFEIGVDGADASSLRGRLGLDSGYLSRLLGSLDGQGLVTVKRKAGDARRRRVALTRKGRVELSSYERLSDELAASLLEALDPARRDRLMSAMEEVERLLRAASVEIVVVAARNAEAHWCRDEYFRELASRFEEGFDPSRDKAGEMSEMTPPTGVFVLARLEGDPVGCGGLKRVDEITGEIKRVWTAPSARGLGVARKVVRRLEAAARDLGLKGVRLDTNRVLTEAQALYRAEGYREVERFGDNPYAHHWFAKEL